MKRNLLLILALSCFYVAFARKVNVTSASAINNGSWVAGDTIVMKNGNWTNQVISFRATGTASNPIVLLAETAGQVILNGNSRLSFSGKYIEINGLFFKNGTLSGSDVIMFRTSSSDVAENCRLTNTTIDSYNPTDNTVDSKWVSLYGKNNQVDHCSFVNKNNSGTLLVVWLQSGVTVNHVISDNYFGKRDSNLDANGDELNGQEIIRVGDSSTSMTTANVTVSGNFFEHCNGEIEIISNKSCGNLYQNNLFFECHGMLTLRHGNGCVVEGNYFFGNGTTESGGVRIIGENHKVYNNYFEKLRGTGYRAAICMVRGKENSALSEYFQVKNALVEFNTMVDCSQSFSINYNSSSSLTLPPIGSTIAHNHICNFTNSNNNVTIDQTNVSGLDITWKNNLMNQGKYSNFSYNSTQVITGKDAKMAIVDTPISMYEPGATSALASYVTSENIDVLKDIRGRDRLSAKIPGASQLSGTCTVSMPEKEKTGAPFYNNPTTGVSAIEDKGLISVILRDKELTIDSSLDGDVKIIDSLGKIVAEKKLWHNEKQSVNMSVGFYVVVFQVENGSRQVKKILIK